MTQREIKFRVFNKDLKLISESFGIFEGFYGSCMYLHVNGKQHIWYPENTVLMQYTGLKDKIGKEIYEGDILLEVDNEIRTYLNRKRISRVYFSEKSNTPFVCELNSNIDKWSEYAHDFNFDNAEIIGNIYENPELIK